MSDNQKKHDIPIAVRHLAEKSHRQGGLATPEYGGIDSVDGIKAHQKFVHSLEQNSHFYDLILTELTLASDVVWQDFNFQLKGRLDCLTVQSDRLTLYEIKSFKNDPLYLPKDGSPAHWAQLIIYAYLLKHSNISSKLLEQNADCLATYESLIEKEEIELILVYSAVDKEQVIFKKKKLTWQEIEDQVFLSLEKYTKYILYFIEWRQIRNQSITKGGFPFSNARKGQHELMRHVLEAIRNKDSLICQAPTGIGKTMATLYPAIKALAAGYNDKIFYSTAMISTREIAEKSIDILRDCGYFLKSIRFEAKERICLQPDIFCDQTLCPYAIDYYERLPAALHELMPEEKITPDKIQQVSRKHQVCPHELSLDYAEFCDILIGDYNHIFDPQAKFERFLNDSNLSISLLIDEAHNLPSRARNMYSAGFSLASLLLFRRIIKTPSLNLAGEFQVLLQNLEETIVAFTEFSENVKKAKKTKSNPFFSNNESRWLIENNFIGVREKPDLLLKKLRILSQDLKDFLDRQKLFEGRQEILDHWFELNYFIQVADLYFNDAYITAFKLDNQMHLSCFLLALDASKYITKSYQKKHATIFFSATLSPLNYYHKLLNANSENYPSDTLSLTSPFPSQNILLATLTEYSLKYKDRENTLMSISKFIFDATQKKIGNYLIFVPSYQYLSKIRNVFLKYFNKSNIRMSFQSRNMSQKQKDNYLKKFDDFGQKVFLSFAVLGSHFNEGIDLVGERLSGVFILGTGFPQISPERELMAQYYSERYEHGKAFGYQYPGFNRVQQAVGRLIRSENDVGFAVMIDQRYESPEWQQIYPDDWQVQNFDQHQRLLEEIELFWSDQI